MSELRNTNQLNHEGERGPSGPAAQPQGAGSLRRGFVVISLLILSLAACSSSSKTSTPTIPPLNSATVPNTIGAPLKIDAFVLSVNIKAHTITVDPMAFLTGAAAKTAYKHDHPAAKDGPPNDYYISDPTKDSVILQLAPSATVRLVNVGGTNHTVPVAAPLTALVGYRSLATHPFQITANNGTVSAIVERFVP